MTLPNAEPFVLGRDVPPSAQPARLAALEAAVRRRTALVPRVALVLGSGLGDLVDAVDIETAIPFHELPGWPAATAPGHAGRLVFGHLAAVPVVVQQGRFHLYEGHSPGFVVQPVLLMRRLGAGVLVLTNAAGGVNPAFGPGTLMIIRDHLNLTGRNPLVGANAPEIGVRFPDMTEVWDAELRHALLAAGEAQGVDLAQGVYAALLGPNYETAAEVRMLAALGADAVGMSTVLEAVAARWAGLRVAGVSLVSNAAAGYTGKELTEAEVLDVAGRVGPRLAAVLRAFVATL